MKQDLDALLGGATNAVSLPLQYEDLPEGKVVSGSARPRVGFAMLGQLGDCALGVWEISPSTSTDVEIEEVFVVLFGEARVSFADGTPDLELKAGTVGRLQRGARTTWNVTRTLRKLFVAVNERA